jgi:hypothetical protein
VNTQGENTDNRMKILRTTVPIIICHIENHFNELELALEKPVQWGCIKKQCRMIMEKNQTITAMLKHRGLFAPEYGRDLCQLCIILHKIERVALDQDYPSLFNTRVMLEQAKSISCELSLQLHNLLETPTELVSIAE